MLSKPLFCFLLALHIPLTFFADNQSLFGLSGVLRTIVILLLVAGAFYFLGVKTVRRPLYAAAIASAPLVFYWLLPLGTLYAAIAALAVILVPVLLGRFLDNQKVIMYINVIALAMLIQPLYSIAVYQVKAATSPETFGDSDYSIFELPADEFTTAQLTPKKSGNPPSILHITLDAYANDAVLSEVVNVDNSGFSNALAELGFTIFPQTVTPYSQTLLAMSSIYTGRYLDFDTLDPNPASSRLTLAQLMASGKAREALYPFGYTYAYNVNGYFADGSIKPRGAIIKEMPPKITDVSGFEFLSLVQRKAFFDQVAALIAELKSKLPAGEEIPSGQPEEKAGMAAVSPSDAMLKNGLESDFISTLPEPFHYSLHLLAPHPPFTIDRHGDPIDTWSTHFGDIIGASHAHKMRPQLQRQYADGYREKLLFINSAILAYVKDAISRVDGPLIIILHGDHGSGVLLDLDSADNSCLRERFSPYLAIYASSPELRKSLQRYAAGRFNLINLYPMLFDEIFEQDIPLKDDHTYFVSWKNLRDRVEISEQQLQDKCRIPWKSRQD